MSTVAPSIIYQFCQSLRSFWWVPASCCVMLYGSLLYPLLFSLVSFCVCVFFLSKSPSPILKLPIVLKLFQMMCIISVSVYVHVSVVCEEARRGHWWDGAPGSLREDWTTLGHLIALQEIMLGSGPGRVGYCLSVRQTAADSTKTRTALFMLIWKPIKLIKGRNKDRKVCLYNLS